MDPEKQTVLVVDDDEAIREYLQYIFEQAGYGVIAAEDGSCVQGVLEEHTICLLIIDLVMPGKEGFETIREIKTEHPQLPVVAISGAVDSDMYLNVAECLGAHACLRKPFQKDGVLKAAENAMRRKREEKAKEA